MARIAIDARIINTSTGRYAERLIHYLEKIDKVNNYLIIVPTKDRAYYQPTNPNFEIITVDIPNYSLAEQTSFLKFLDGLGADLVHFAMPQQPVVYRGRKVTTFHDLTLLKTYNSDKGWLKFHLKQLVGRYVFRRVALSNDHIITPSEFTKQELQSFFPVPTDRISVIYEAGETTASDASAYKLPFQRYIMYVGSQSDYKNITRLAEAHQQLLATHPDLGLVLVGKKDVMAQRHDQLFSDRGYRNILFTGFVSDGELNWLYANAAAYVFPSLMEGFGLPGLEAMSRGLPVVSSNATCLPEVYGPAAIYFDPMNVGEMASAIDSVVSDESLRQSLIEAGHQQVAKYSWEKMARETLAVYEQILKN